MDESALQFNPEPLQGNNLEHRALEFRERGIAMIPDVFLPESIDAFREQMQERVEVTGEAGDKYHVPYTDPLVLEPARAPRLLAALKRCFEFDGFDAGVTLFHPAWVVAAQNLSEDLEFYWHKDADHEGRCAANGYLYPRRIHAWMPFEDMTVDHGPTYVIPGSHRNIDLSPHRGAEPSPLLCRKQDVILWDQRTWHRGSARRLPGMRMIAIFGFYGNIGRFDRTDAQRAAFEQAQTEQERVLFGGTFGAEGVSC